MSLCRAPVSSGNIPVTKSAPSEWSQLLNAVVVAVLLHGNVEATGLRNKALNIFERENPSPAVSSNLGILTSHETPNALGQG